MQEYHTMWPQHTMWPEATMWPKATMWPNVQCGPDDIIYIFKQFIRSQRFSIAFAFDTIDVYTIYNCYVM